MDKPELLIMKVLPDLGKLNAMLKHLMAQMGDTDDPNEVIRRINACEWVAKLADLLTRITTVKVSGAAKFVVKDHLKSASIGWIGDNFKKLFFEKTEENFGDAAVVVHRLEKSSSDAPIIVELGNRAEIKLAHFFSLLEAQSKGQEGALTVDGSANIAYIIGDDGNFWAVRARWCSSNRCWDVGASSVEDQGKWCAGHQVLACDLL